MSGIEFKKKLTVSVGTLTSLIHVMSTLTWYIEFKTTLLMLHTKNKLNGIHRQRKVTLIIYIYISLFSDRTKEVAGPPPIWPTSLLLVEG